MLPLLGPQLKDQSRVCCVDRLLSLVGSYLFLLTFLRTDVPDVRLPSNDERGEQFVAEVSAYIEREAYGAL